MKVLSALTIGLLIVPGTLLGTPSQESANFVSQCLAAGGLNLWRGSDGKGKGVDQRGRIYNCDDLLKHLENFQNTEIKTYEGSFDAGINFVQPGDVIIFDKSGIPGMAAHASLITEAKNGKIKIAGHCGPDGRGGYNKENFEKFFPSPFGRMNVIHILNDPKYSRFKNDDCGFCIEYPISDWFTRSEGNYGKEGKYSLLLESVPLMKEKYGTRFRPSISVSVDKVSGSNDRETAVREYAARFIRKIPLIKEWKVVSSIGEQLNGMYTGELQGKEYKGDIAFSLKNGNVYVVFFATYRAEYEKTENLFREFYKKFKIFIPGEEI
jgi:hypothetical protein